MQKITIGSNAAVTKVLSMFEAPDNSSLSCTTSSDGELELEGEAGVDVDGPVEGETDVDGAEFDEGFADGAGTPSSPKSARLQTLAALPLASS